jgi:triosephosphate isomerase (TIM)
VSKFAAPWVYPIGRFCFYENNRDFLKNRESSIIYAMTTNKKLIVGNWKMNPTGPADAKKIFGKIAGGASKYKWVETVICPPAVFLDLMGKVRGVRLGAPASASKLRLGGQDGFYETEGAYTGSISMAMLKSLGAEYVLVGHSERRNAGETDEIINRKIKAGLKQGLKIILCVGEKVHDENGEYLKVLQMQLSQALAGVNKKYFNQIIVAHEPVWAIGALAKGADTHESFAHNRLFIKKILVSLAGKKVGLTIPILYGGSVGVKNAEMFLTEGGADGLLVGRASLVPQDFVKIIQLADNSNLKAQNAKLKLKSLN